MLEASFEDLLEETGESESAKDYSKISNCHIDETSATESSIKNLIDNIDYSIADEIRINHSRNIEEKIILKESLKNNSYCDNDKKEVKNSSKNLNEIKTGLTDCEFMSKVSPIRSVYYCDLDDKSLSSCDLRESQSLRIGNMNSDYIKRLSLPADIDIEFNQFSKNYMPSESEEKMLNKFPLKCNKAFYDIVSFNFNDYDWKCDIEIKL